MSMTAVTGLTRGPYVPRALWALRPDDAGNCPIPTAAPQVNTGLTFEFNRSYGLIQRNVGSET